MGAFHEVGDRLGFIQTRHEEIAAFAATAHAKFTGEVGVCMATSGPGAIHLLNGLYDAKLDHQPVVAVIGQQKRMSLGANYQQEVDLFKDVASEYLMTIMDPTQARHVIDRAVRIAQASRSVTAVIVPEDVQEAEHQEAPRMQGAVYSSIGLSELGAGVAKALNGRAALPDDLPFVTGAIGLLGTKPSYDMMMGCDTLLIVGSNFPYADGSAARSKGPPMGPLPPREAWMLSTSCCREWRRHRAGERRVLRARGLLGIRAGPPRDLDAVRRAGAAAGGQSGRR
jgi:pyruvate dehydrogenase (quinone)